MWCFVSLLLLLMIYEQLFVLAFIDWVKNVKQQESFVNYIICQFCYQSSSSSSSSSSCSGGNLSSTSGVNKRPWFERHLNN